MAKAGKSEKEAELLGPDVPLPEGAREVRRTTVERFIDVGEGRAAAESDEDKPERERLNSAADDFEPGDLEFEPVEELSPMQRLLRDLKERNAGSGPVVIYAKRKPDPVGMVFRNPCNAEKTVGEVPYDESDLSIEALELSIQKLYGGGRYQIIVRQSGDYAGAITRNIADPPEKEPPARHTAPSAQHEVTAPEVRSAKSRLDEVRSSVEIVKEVAALLNSTRPTEPRHFPPTAPPADPLETMRGAIALVKEVSSISGAGGSSSSGETSPVRDWTEGLAGIAREFGLGQLLNNLAMFAVHEAARQRAGAAATTTSSPGPEGGMSPPQMPAPSAAVPGPLPEPQGETAATRESTPSIGGLPLEMLPPQMRLALENALSVFVSEMQRSELSDEHETERAEIALREFIEAFPQGYTVVDYFMQQSSVRVLYALSSFKPEWESILDLKGAAGFIEVVQDEWAAAKAPAEDDAAEPASVQS